MAIADAFTLTIGGTGYVMNRTYVLGSRSEYTDATGMVKAIVSHKYTGTRVSRLTRVEQKITLASGAVTKHSFHTVNEYDTNSVSATQAKDLEVATATWKAASTNAVIVKVIAGES